MNLTLKRASPALALTFALSACGPTVAQQDAAVMQQVHQRLMAARQACDAQHPKVRGTAVPNARCWNDAANRLYWPYVNNGYPADLIAVIQTTRLALAAKVDKGELSPEDAELHLAQTVSQADGTANERAASNRATNAANLAAVAGVVGMMNANAPPPYQLPAPRLPILNRTLTCDPIGGGGFTCN